jgi:hypothetical protein
VVALGQHLIAGAANANEFRSKLPDVLAISRKRERRRRDEA